MSQPANDTVVVIVESGETKSEPFYLGSYRFGSVQCPTAMDGATLNYEVSNVNDEARYMAAKDENGAAVLSDQTVAANECVDIPTTVAHKNWAKLVVAQQSADREFLVAKKG